MMNFLVVLLLTSFYSSNGQPLGDESGHAAVVVNVDLEVNPYAGEGNVVKMNVAVQKNCNGHESNEIVTLPDTTESPTENESTTATEEAGSGFGENSTMISTGGNVTEGYNSTESFNVTEVANSTGITGIGTGAPGTTALP